MYYFCTYFDQHYFARGLALYCSLREHCSAFELWVLCMDHVTYQLLEEAGLPGLHPIALEEFERHDEPLRSAKQNRSRIEYYFTCTPSLPLYVLHNWSEVDLITYLDADLFFFASPVPLFEELDRGSIAIIGHRFPPHLRHLETYGIYSGGVNGVLSGAMIGQRMAVLPIRSTWMTGQAVFRMWSCWSIKAPIWPHGTWAIIGSAT